MSDELARLRNRVEQLEAKLERTDSQFQRLVSALSRSVDANNRSLTGMMGYTAQLGERVQLIEDDLNGVDEEMAKEAQRRLDDPNAKHVPFIMHVAGVADGRSGGTQGETDQGESAGEAAGQGVGCLAEQSQQRSQQD